MKRYLLFAYPHSGPLGGWRDFQGDFDYELDAKNAAKQHQAWHIVDTETKKMVFFS